MKSILIVNQFGIGDVLFTFPMVSAIKDSDPEARIGYLCNRRTEEIVKNNPGVSDIFVYEKDELRAKGAIGHLGGLSKLYSDIKKKKYDAVIDLSLQRLFGFGFYLMGIKKRIGYDYKNRGAFLTDKIIIDGYHDKHMVNYYADLLRFLNVQPRNLKMELPVNSKDNDWADNIFRQNKINTQDMLAAVIPGGGASWGQDAAIKQWDSSNFAEIADKLNKKYNARIIILGSEKDRALGWKIKQKLGDKALDLCGKTSLGKFAAVLKRCRLAVCNDGGPLHVAVAVGTRTVSIFGPVDEKVYGPFGQGKHSVVKADVACRPCYRSFKYRKCQDLVCLKKVSVDEVLAACEKTLGEN